MAVLINKKHKLAIRISGVGVFESDNELDADSFENQVKAIRGLSTSLELTLAEALLGDKVGDYMRLAYGGGLG